jgi:dihydroorotate dehydrogenase (fumarate)
MANLQVTYLGLNLKNPLVVGASNLTDNVESIKALAKAGAGAIVLKSLFEEQIKIDMAKVNKPYDPIHQHVESNDYQLFYETQHEVEQYLKLITQAKEAVDIPIIASINCSTADNWTSFAHKIESAGADALELNVFILPSDPKKSAEEIRKTYFDIIKKVSKTVHIPIAIKLGYYFDNVAGMLQKISKLDIAGLVLFNRFYLPDIDLEKEELKVGSYLTTSDDKANTLRWIGIMRDIVDCDIAATTGIHSSDDLIKMILVGADAVQMVSAIYKNSPSYISEVLQQVTDWMDKHGYATIDEFKGKLSKAGSKNNEMYERVQFMRYSGKE